MTTFAKQDISYEKPEELPAEKIAEIRDALRNGPVTSMPANKIPTCYKPWLDGKDGLGISKK